MIHHASQLIANTFDQKGIKYGGKIIEDGNCSEVHSGFSIDNGPLVMVRFISADEDNDVMVRAFAIVHNVTEDHRQQMLNALNQLNEKYRFVQFTLDKDNDVNASYDFPMETKDDSVGPMAREIFIRFCHILNNAYPEMMQAIYGEAETAPMKSALLQ